MRTARGWAGCGPRDCATRTYRTFQAARVVSRHTPRTRAHDTDRAQACGRLDTAYADGHLDFEP
ncbi:DUF1707 domain-containing protein [Rhodococcus rhodochrous]|uniref:DUF1707 domain-containing protein n=1 Tax=Rhodococcus rhodochrous TaxID=1829 RepID=UPI003083108C